MTLFPVRDVMTVMNGATNATQRGNNTGVSRDIHAGGRTGGSVRRDDLKISAGSGIARLIGLDHRERAWNATSKIVNRKVGGAANLSSERRDGSGLVAVETHSRKSVRCPGAADKPDRKTGLTSLPFALNLIFVGPSIRIGPNSRGGLLAREDANLRPRRAFTKPKRGGQQRAKEIRKSALATYARAVELARYVSPTGEARRIGEIEQARTTDACPVTAPRIL